MLKEFRVDMRSQFSTNDGRRVNRGDWVPTFFAYIEIPFEGRKQQWLIVSYCKDVRVLLNGKEYILTLRPVEGEIKGMEGLAEPGTYRKLYKILS